MDETAWYQDEVVEESCFLSVLSGAFVIPHFLCFKKNLHSTLYILREGGFSHFFVLWWRFLLLLGFLA